MAIQNFLSGGFYGSVGDLTGRRWKNRRIVQQKYKPSNPRTPAQERQRMLFTQGSALAKIAQQVNWKCPQFQSPIKTDWNQRQTVAINALKDGMPEWEALPLCPKDFVASHQIGTCTITEITDNNEIKFLLEGTNLLTDKKYACAIFIQSGEKKGAILVGSGETDAGSATNITIRFQETDGIKDEECYIKIASYDDVEVDTVTLSAGIPILQLAPPPYEFNPRVSQITYDTDNTLRVSVILGDEPIESYDAFENTVVRIYDYAWTKQTAVTAGTLSTDNRTAINITPTITRTTVAKSTATVTFAYENMTLWQYEKFAAKVDITINAKNVKSEDSDVNSMTINLTAQAFPEYIQELPTFTNPQYLRCHANTIGKDGIFVYLTGETTALNDTSEKGNLLYITQGLTNASWNESGLTEVIFDGGTIYDGSDIQYFYEDYTFDFRVNGNRIGIGAEEEDFESIKGSWNWTFEATQIKIAYQGYRVYTAPTVGSGRAQIQMTFWNN